MSVPGPSGHRYRSEHAKTLAKLTQVQLSQRSRQSCLRATDTWSLCVPVCEMGVTMTLFPGAQSRVCAAVPERNT